MMKERIQDHLPSEFHPVVGVVYSLSGSVVDQETAEVENIVLQRLVMVGWVKDSHVVPTGYVFNIEDGVIITSSIRRGLPRPESGGRCDQTWATDQALELIERLNPQYNCRVLEEIFF